MSLETEFADILSNSQINEAKSMTKGEAQARAAKLRNDAYASGVTATERKNLLAQARAFRNIANAYCSG